MSKTYTIKDIVLIRSDRKSLSIQVKKDCTVLVRASFKTSEQEINKFLAEKSEWIEKTVQKMKENINSLKDTKQLSDNDIANLTLKAKEILPQKVEHFAEVIGVDYGKIAIKHQKSRWGSCSSKGNLNFNCLIMLMPDEIIDYIVVHELCHRKEMNHSYYFKLEVEKVLPDCKKREKWLKENGPLIMLRYTGI